MIFSIAILSLLCSTSDIHTAEAFSILRVNKLTFKSDININPRQSKHTVHFASSKKLAVDFPSYDFPYEAAKLDRPQLPDAPNAKKAEKPKQIGEVEPPPTPPPTPPALTKLESLKKEILSKSANANLSTTGVNLNVSELSSVAPYIAAPVLGLVTLRINKAQREKIQAEKAAKEEAERLAKAKRGINISFDTKKLKSLADSASKSSSVAINKAKEDAAKRLKESNIDVDEDTLVKSVGALGAGIVTAGLVLGAGKPRKELSVTKDKPNMDKGGKKKPTKPKPFKEEVIVKEEKAEQIKFEEKAKDKLISKVETPVVIDQPKLENSNMKSKAKEIPPPISKKTASVKPETSTTEKTDKKSLPLPSSLAVTSFAALVAFRINLINTKARRDEEERKKRMENFTSDMDDAIEMAKASNALLQMKLDGMRDITTDEKSPGS